MPVSLSRNSAVRPRSPSAFWASSSSERTNSGEAASSGGTYQRENARPLVRDQRDVGLLRQVRDRAGLRDARRALADVQEQLGLPGRVHERVIDRVLATRRHVIEVDLMLVVRVPAEGGEVGVHDPVTDLLFGNVLHVAEDFSRDLTEV